jgi:pyridoxine kinase
MLHGTGDLYASALLAGIMAGRTFAEAVLFAGRLTHDAMLVSAKQPHFKERGVSFEPLLGAVAGLLTA